MIPSLNRTIFKRFVGIKNRAAEIRTPDRDAIGLYARDNGVRAKHPDGNKETLSPNHTAVDSSNTTSYTTKETDRFVGVDTNNAAVTVTLDSASATRPDEKVIKDEGGNAGTNAISVETEGSETIDGSASTSVGTNGGQVRLYSDGTNWHTY